jgi:hypothetical protein
MYYPTCHKLKEGKRTGHILSKNCLLKDIVEGKIEGEIEMTGRRGRRVSSYRMTARKPEDVGNGKGKYQIALYGELPLQESMDLP